MIFKNKCGKVDTPLYHHNNNNNNNVQEKQRICCISPDSKLNVLLQFLWIKLSLLLWALLACGIMLPILKSHVIKLTCHKTVEVKTHHQ